MANDNDADNAYRIPTEDNAFEGFSPTEVKGHETNAPEFEAEFFTETNEAETKT